MRSRLARGRFPVSIRMLDRIPAQRGRVIPHPPENLGADLHRSVHPRTTVLLGQDVSVVDPRTLLHLYGTVGVDRRRDTPRIAGLARAVSTGESASRFADADGQAFVTFRKSRRRRYPLFFAAKYTWVILLDTLPPGVAQALTHDIQLRANQFSARSPDGPVSRR